ncbi:NADPH--cytochrome P450 reductase-like [Pan paniscus]|uniref:NADPH--cytochrome P450 reductase-like n=1 Tax=Pan paniscus TaxID=9597 RepID=UPI0015616747|nr:NADPH--cytochrome P450 reductase-like [Pan paniscus]
MRRPGSSRGLTRARGSVEKGMRVQGGRRLWGRTAEPVREARWASEGAGACGGSREGASTMQPPPSAPAAAAGGPPPPPTAALFLSSPGWSAVARSQLIAVSASHVQEILSSSKVHPNSVHICAVVVEYETKAGRINKGVATNWLRAKEPAGENGGRALVPMFVRKSQFRLPFKATTPVIMVGPGTGVAPFIGFIQERAWLRQQGKEVGETLLYYGCRRSDEDYLYREELAQFHRDGALTQLNVAFSREQSHKVYVQHLLKRDREHLWKLIEGGAHIYVCGDARNMARDVQNTFYDIVAELGAMEHAQAVDYIKKLMTKGRYSLDVWS